MVPRKLVANILTRRERGRDVCASGSWYKRGEGVRETRRRTQPDLEAAASSLVNSHPSPRPTRLPSSFSLLLHHGTLVLSLFMKSERTTTDTPLPSPHSPAHLHVPFFSLASHLLAHCPHSRLVPKLVRFGQHNILATGKVRFLVLYSLRQGRGKDEMDELELTVPSFLPSRGPPLQASSGLPLSLAVQPFGELF